MLGLTLCLFYMLLLVVFSLVDLWIFFGCRFILLRLFFLFKFPIYTRGVIYWCGGYLDVLSICLIVLTL